MKILITGMPFSGKSYISSFLKKKGFNAVDADTVKGLGRWTDGKGNIVQFPTRANKKWLDDHIFIWDKNILLSWLKEQRSDIYLFGLSANVLELAGFFYKAYYLDLTPDRSFEKPFCQ